MYCGSNKTALGSQQQTAEALLSLMADKPFAEISVCELCKASGISRQTFYTLFSSKENVILFLLQSRICPEEIDESCTLASLCDLYSRYICRNKDMLRILVDNGLLYLLYDQVRDSFLHCDCCDCAAAPDEQSLYTANFLAGGLTGIVNVSVQSDSPLDPEALSRTILNLFSGGFASNI